MAYSIQDIYPKRLLRPNEERQIETARRRLWIQSEEVRRGNKRPNLTAIRLARSALLLASSKASPFEKVHTLNAAYANLRARHVNQRSIRTIAELSQQALENAHSPTDHEELDELHRIDILSRRRAIEHTTPATPFIVALNEARTYYGYHVDPPEEKKVGATDEDEAPSQIIAPQDIATGELADFAESHTKTLLPLK